MIDGQEEECTVEDDECIQALEQHQDPVGRDAWLGGLELAREQHDAHARQDDAQAVGEQGSVPDALLTQQQQQQQLEWVRSNEDDRSIDRWMH